MSVIDMAEWVSERVGTPPVTCECGSQWFVVDAVILDVNMSVGGFAGIPRCHECGKQI